MAMLGRKKKGRRRNPAALDESRFRNDMVELVQANPTDAIDVAWNWKQKFHNAMMEAETATKHGLELAAGLGSAGFIAWLDGRQEAEAEALAAQLGLDLAADGDPFSAVEESDPRKFLGLDIPFWWTAAQAGVAFFDLGGEYNDLIAAGAKSSAAYYVGSMAYNYGRRARAEAIAQEAVA